MFRNCDGKHQRLSFWFAKLAQTIVTYTLICFIGESLQDKVSLWLWITARWRPVLLIVWLPGFNLQFGFVSSSPRTKAVVGPPALRSRFPLQNADVACSRA
jgi:hypothetical protein